MKTMLLTISLLLLSAAPTLSVGSVVFQNLAPEGLGKYVSMPDGTRVRPTSESGIIAGLYWLNPASDEFQMLGEPAPFFLPGYYFGGLRETPFAGTFTFEVRAWDSTLDETYIPTYEEAAVIRGILMGESGPFQLETGDPDGIPFPTPPSVITPLVSGFTLYYNPVPEPTTVALVALGIFSTFLLRSGKLHTHAHRPRQRTRLDWR